MHKHIRAALCAAFFIAFAAASASANEMARVFGIILQSAETISEQYAAALSIRQLNDPTSAEFIGDALDRLLESRSTVKSPAEKEQYERLTRLYAKMLGDWRYSNSAASLWRTVKESPDPLTRSEALIALGGIRALEYAELIALMLRDLNAKPAADADAGEKLAYGCILALEGMKSPVGFAPLFFASEAWYTRRIRDQAARSLPLVLEDPTEILMGLMDTEETPRKLRALDLALSSKAPEANKIKAAAHALHAAIINQGRDRPEATLYATMRRTAMNALVSLKDKSGNSAPDFKEAYRIGDLDEKLTALRAMGNDASAASASVLAEIITTLNEEQRSGVSSEDRNTLMKSALQNAGVNGHKNLFLALNLVKGNSKWSDSILRLATEALKSIK